MFAQNIKLILYLTILSVLTACGGGEGADDNESDLLANKEVSTGVITGFGSVFVNGTRYDTSSASITADNSILNDVTELKVGMVATVTSDSSTMASNVDYEEDVKGPVDSPVADFSAPFSVMSQTVIVDSATVVDDSLTFSINSGDILEVSGIRQGDDSILATYIEDKDPTKVSKYKVIGNARSVDTIAKTFSIDGLTVNYASANVDDLLSGDPSVGQLVEVKDENKTYLAGSGVLIASKVEPFDIFSGNGDDNESISHVEIETVVIGITDPGVQFQIPNYTVNILPATSFRYGIADEIGIGTVLQIKAIKNGDDELDATRITFKRNSARMDASVDVGGVDVTANQLTILGITVQINSDTEMEDKWKDVSPFDISDIGENDYLEIRGFAAANGTFVATRLERDGARDRVEIRSIVSNIDPVAQSLELLGLTVTAGTETKFNNGAATAEDFFIALTEGLTIVKVRWDSFVDTSSAPKAMEVEDDFSLNKF